MKQKNKEILIDKLNDEIQNMYHNARWDWVECESDYESDLLESILNEEASMDIQDLNEGLSDIDMQDLGQVYSWGRSGATLAPEKLIKMKGGSLFAFIDALELDYTYEEMSSLLIKLTEFNRLVREYCKNKPNGVLEYIRQEYKDDLDDNKDKKRVYYSGYKYI